MPRRRAAGNEQGRNPKLFARAARHSRKPRPTALKPSRHAARIGTIKRPLQGGWPSGRRRRDFTPARKQSDEIQGEATQEPGRRAQRAGGAYVGLGKEPLADDASQSIEGPTCLSDRWQYQCERDERLEVQCLIRRQGAGDCSVLLQPRTWRSSQPRRAGSRGSVPRSRARCASH